MRLSLATLLVGLGELISGISGIRSHGNKSARIKPCDIIRSSGIRRNEFTLGSNRSRGFSQGEILKR